MELLGGYCINRIDGAKYKVGMIILPFSFEGQ